MADQRVPSRALLLGDDPRRSRRWVAAAVGLFVAVFAVSFAGASRPVYAAVPGTAIVVGGAVALGTLAAWQAASNRGLLVSVLLAVAPVTALFVRIVAAGQTSDPTLVTVLVRGTAFGLLFGVPIGLGGFAIGYVVGRFRGETR